MQVKCIVHKNFSRILISHSHGLISYVLNPPPGAASPRAINGYTIFASRKKPPKRCTQKKCGYTGLRPQTAFNLKYEWCLLERISLLSWAMYTRISSLLQPTMTLAMKST